MKKLHIFKILISFILFAQLGFAMSKPLQVTYVSNLTKNDYLGSLNHSFAQASASDLGVDLEIKILKNRPDRFDYLESLKEVFQREKKPDFVIATFYEKITVDILNLAQSNNIPIFIVNSNISRNNKKSVGKLRRKFSTFMGHISPNDEKVGYDLAKYLIKLKRESNPDGRLKVSAMAISKKNIKSKQRLKGLKKAVKEEYLTKLYKTVYTSAGKQESYIQTSRLIKKYYDLNVVWTESNSMSLGANEAMVDNGLQDQTITGGIGISKESLTSIQDGGVKAIIGGTFMDAGFALVLIHDYLKGKDYFEQYPLKIDSNMFIINSKNANTYAPILNSQNWDKINFKKISKVYNTSLAEYDFSIDNLLK